MPSSDQDTSHIRMAAWLAVAAVAVSSGAISYSAGAAEPTKPQQTQQNPMVVISRQLNALQLQGKRIESGIERIEKDLESMGQGGQGDMMLQGQDQGMMQGQDQGQGKDQGMMKGKPPMMGGDGGQGGQNMTDQQREEMMRKYKEEMLRKQAATGTNTNQTPQ